MKKPNQIAADGAPTAGAGTAAYLRRALQSIEVQEHDEFPLGQDRPPDALTRRELLQLLGASMALAGASGCVEQPSDLLMPYVRNPLERPKQEMPEYATSMVLDGYAVGLVVKTSEGRPIKVEGNPEHPASLGASGAFEQASVLQLYDPNRARAVQHQRAPSSWDAFLRQLPKAENRPRLWFVLPPQSSPHLLALIERLQARYSEARFVFDSPVARPHAYQAAQSVFGRPLEPQYDFSRARVVLSLGSDFAGSGPMHLRWARQFAEQRRIASPRDPVNRLYVAETMPTPTGTLADHHLRVLPQQVAALATAVYQALVTGKEGWERQLEQVGLKGRVNWVRAAISDLKGHPGASLVIAGEQQPASIHALAFALNRALGNIGRTLHFTEPVLARATGGLELEDLVAAVEQQQVDGVVVLEGNPVYTAPVELGLRDWLSRVPYTAHLSLYYNETSQSCGWFVPAAHFLESWGDARAQDGTVSLIQPLIRPMYSGKTSSQLIAAFLGHRGVSDKLLLERYWLPRLSGPGGARQLWQRHLQRGFIEGSALPSAQLSWNDSFVEKLNAQMRESPQLDAGLTVVFEPSRVVHDGRFANNGWLLELPQPITTLTWGNALIVSPQTAESFGLEDEDRVELSVGGRRVEGAILTVPGHADNAVTLTLGFGRSGTESLARDVGFNAFALRTRAGSHVTSGARMKKLGGKVPLALAQRHFEQQGRGLALHAKLADYRNNPEALTSRHRGPVPSLLPVLNHSGQQWGMTIDTGICTGCSSCVVACQAENNIPIVGRRGVEQGRSMHWLRIDQYRHGDAADPSRVHQPMLCQHCEKAPCEYVCPVYATVHSPDGLNEMVYNRCVGTRFCSNNCPYKVRRFNWFEYASKDSRKLQYNPEVTVRARGVMEKCTYCVQRIRRAHLVSEQSGREEQIQTACQQACPTGAIQFGDVAVADNQAAQWRRQPRVYAVLHDLGTQPRTLYLAKLYNKNPELGEAS